MHAPALCLQGPEGTAGAETNSPTLSQDCYRSKLQPQHGQLQGIIPLGYVPPINYANSYRLLIRTFSDVIKNLEDKSF